MTIAHRFHTIIDADRVLVMDGGRVIEFESSKNLMKNSNGLFNEMCRKTGSSMYMQLCKQAMKGKRKT